MRIVILVEIAKENRLIGGEIVGVGIGDVEALEYIAQLC